MSYYLDNIVPAKIEGGEGWSVTQGGAGQAPDVVVGEVQPLQLGQALESILL